MTAWIAAAWLLPLGDLHALAQAAPVDEGGPGALRIVLVGLLIVAPIYLFLVFFVRIVRETYGFVEPPEDSGPPLRVCGGCHNTILESEYLHCPYCGRDLPVVALDSGEPLGAAKP